MLNITSAKDIQLNKILMLLGGNSGDGKTYSASTTNCKTLLISIESGEFSLKGKDVDILRVKGNNGIEKINSLFEIMKELPSLEYDCIYVDSLTEIAQCIVEYATSKYPEEKQALKKWGYYNESMVKFVKFFRDLNKNVIMTTLLKIDKDEMSRRFKVPDVSGSIAMRLPQYFDFVFNIVIREDKENNTKERYVLTESLDGNICKSRSQNLETYELLNIGNIFQKIKGE